MSTEIHVRPFAGNGNRFDYTTLATLYRRIWPHRRVDPARLRALDHQRRAMGPAVRRIAEVDGQPIGVGEVHRSPYFAEPGHFVVQVGAVPGWRHEATFGPLNAAMEAAVEPFAATRFVTFAAHTDTAALAFARSQGFGEFQRETEFVVDLAAFDPTPHLARLNKPAEHGIDILAISELAHDQHRDARLWELDAELFGQIPGEQGRRPEFEAWRQQVLLHDEFLAEGSFVARDRASGEYVGMTTLFAEGSRRDRAMIELTGVRASHRRMGLATALKLRSLMWAQAAELTRLRTFNDTSNEPIRRLNESLGFVAGRDWLSLGRDLSQAARVPAKPATAETTAIAMA